MRIVIQCAGSKQGGGYWTTSTGRRVAFVGDPRAPSAPDTSGALLVKPDEIAEGGRTWRQQLSAYNDNEAATNPKRLWPAWQLYESAAYGKLVRRFGVESVYILSAGWGLVRANYLLPQYDITFSSSGAPNTRRRGTARFADFNQLSLGDEGIVFLGGKTYVPLFLQLTRGHRCRRVVVYNSAQKPRAEGIEFVRYPSAARTNWHYQCADDLANGRFAI
jgi:hypothetical protein